MNKMQAMELFCIITNHSKIITSLHFSSICSRPCLNWAKKKENTVLVHWCGEEKQWNFLRLIQINQSSSCLLLISCSFGCVMERNSISPFLVSFIFPSFFFIFSFPLLLSFMFFAFFRRFFLFPFFILILIPLRWFSPFYLLPLRRNEWTVKKEYKSEKRKEGRKYLTQCRGLLVHQHFQPVGDVCCRCCVRINVCCVCIVCSDLRRKEATDWIVIVAFIFVKILFVGLLLVCLFIFRLLVSP